MKYKTENNRENPMKLKTDFSRNERRDITIGYYRY